MELLTFASAADWAAWLEDNHRTTNGAWVAFPTKGNEVASVTRREAVDLALCFGWIDGQAASAALPPGWWAQRFTPRRARSRWSKINRRKAEKLIEAGLMRPAGLEQVRLAQADGRWAAAYDPPSTAEVPADLQAALDACPEAAAAFAALDARRRYRMLLDLQGVRRPENRARHIARRIGTLAAGDTSAASSPGDPSAVASSRRAR